MDSQEAKRLKRWVMFGSIPKFSLEKTYPMPLADEWLQFRSYFLTMQVQI